MSDLRRKRRRVEIDDNKELEEQLNSVISNEYTKLESEVAELSANESALSKRKKERKKRLEGQLKKIKMIQKTRVAMGQLPEEKSVEEPEEVNLNTAKPILFQANTQDEAAYRESQGKLLLDSLENKSLPSKNVNDNVKMEDEEERKTDFSLTELQNQLNSEIQEIAAKHARQRRFTQKVDYKKALALQEVDQVKNIFSMQEFRQDPFAALQQHLQNKIAQETSNPYSTLVVPENYSRKKNTRVRSKRNFNGRGRPRYDKPSSESKVSGTKRKRED